MKSLPVNIPGLKELWEETLGDPNICIAILDGPVDQSHPSLASANLKQLETLVSNSANSANKGSAFAHGTHIASVIFGQHDGEIKGIAPRCRGLSIPIFNDGARSWKVIFVASVADTVLPSSSDINASTAEI